MKHKPSSLLFGLCLVVGMAQGTAAREWGGMQGPQASAPLRTQVPAAVPVAPIIDDPLGDHLTSPGNLIVDIDTVAGGTDGTDVTIKVNFSPDTVMSEVVGYIDLDTDQNPTTGISPNANLYLGTTQDIGVDFFLSLFSLPFSGLVDVYNSTFGWVGSVPATIVGQTLEVTIPLAMLGGDDGTMDVGMVLGNFSEPTDAAPTMGHGTIPVGPAPVGGVVTGMSPKRVMCLNVTTGHGVTMLLNGATSWDCAAMGLVVNTGDIIVQKVRGTAN